ncbi:MSHA biogenesis protein MshK [Vibrio sp. 10N.286.49.B3]|uniref:MSHA biogenesis protein MshK n=1 Tax=Vibrio sp. 10N.286.49.B3 TaxID=1880855 RepID=UPI001F5320EA|nr:MSHA biogenesis protein MshK [Vibrio sp. 10N.286.49.B3]
MLSLILALFSFSSQASQDPTAPLGWTAPAEKKAPPRRVVTQARLPTLQSVMCQTDAPCYAILNGQVVGQGDTFRGYRVKTVNDKYVTIQRSGKQWNLSLFPNDIKE